MMMFSYICLLIYSLIIAMRCFKFLLLGVLCTLAFSSGAWARKRSVRLDLLGAVNGVGVSYDARFKGDSGWGFAAGVGYGFGLSNWFESHGVGVPLEINYLAGRRKHFFEAGVGMSNGVYFDKITESSTVTMPDGSWGILPEEHGKTQWGQFLYANVGYRLLTDNGLVFRCGLNPSYGFGKYGLSKSVFYPYFSLGYSF